jgi:hypothetical protein
VRLIFAAVLALLASVVAQANPCYLMVLDSTDNTLQNKVLSFATESAVSQFFGTNAITTIASDWNTNGGYGSCNGSTEHFYAVRLPVTSARAHLFGGNLDASWSSMNTSSGVSSFT